MVDSGSDRKGLLITTHGFRGFSFPRGRVILGVLTFASAPATAVEQLEQMTWEKNNLQAEVTRLTQENQNLKSELARIQQEKETAEAELNQVKNENASKLGPLQQENEHLKSEIDRLAKEEIAEVERLKALAERMSYGVR